MTAADEARVRAIVAEMLAGQGGGGARASGPMQGPQPPEMVPARVDGNMFNHVMGNDGRWRPMSQPSVMVDGSSVVIPPVPAFPVDR